MKENQITALLKEKGVFRAFMSMIWRNPFSIFVSSSEHFLFDVEDSQLSFAELKGKEKTAYVICHSYYPYECYKFFLGILAERNGCADYPVINLKMNREIALCWEYAMMDTASGKERERKTIPFEELTQFLNGLELYDVILHDKSDIENRPRLESDIEFSFYHKYGDIRGNISSVDGSIRYHFLRKMEIDFLLEGSATQIGVIKAKMTENPYRLKPIVTEQMQILNRKNIWGIPYFVTEFADGKPHTYENIVSVSCIACFGTEYWSYELDDIARTLTNDELLHELQEASKQIPGSRCYVSDDAEKVIDKLEKHPLMKKNSNCVYTSE